MELTSKAEILVFYANAIDNIGEDGARIYGCSVHYLFWGEGGTALLSKSEPDVAKPVGMQRGKSWLDYDFRNKVRIAPAIYVGDFQMTVGSDGKPTLKLVDLAYKSNVKIEPYVINNLYVPGMVNPPAFAAQYEAQSNAMPDYAASGFMPVPDTIPEHTAEVPAEQPDSPAGQHAAPSGKRK